MAYFADNRQTVTQGVKDKFKLQTKAKI